MPVAVVPALLSVIGSALGGATVATEAGAGIGSLVASALGGIGGDVLGQSIMNVGSGTTPAVTAAGTPGINPSVPASDRPINPNNPAGGPSLPGNVQQAVLQQAGLTPQGAQLSPSIAQQIISVLGGGSPVSPFSTESASRSGTGVASLPGGSGASNAAWLESLAGLGNPGAANTAQVVGGVG